MLERYSVIVAALLAIAIKADPRGNMLRGDNAESVVKLWAEIHAHLSDIIEQTKASSG